jgi:Domain of unknown function (DUF4193)
MATTDYDAPRTGGVDLAEESLEQLTARRDDTQSASVDVDDTADVFELPGAEFLDEELTVAVIPMRGDEFRCSSCFLVHHRSQLASQRGDVLICRECV